MIKNTTVVRVKGNYEFGDSTKGSQATIDRAYVDLKFGSNVSAKAGRFPTNNWWRFDVR